MAKYREAVCKYYIAFGACSKNRNAEHAGYCQHCGKYIPRARTRHCNRKKAYNERQFEKGKDFL